MRSLHYADKKIGNAKNQKEFDQIWISKKAKEIRDFIKKRRCSCWASCEVGLSIAKNPKMVLRNIFKDYMKLKNAYEAIFYKENEKYN